MNRPIRALHVVGAMNRGGVETWLLNVMRRLSRDDVAIDLMVHTREPAAYDEEVEALGATIHRNSHTPAPLRYGRRLRRVLSGSRRYDVVHSHVHHYSGVVLTAAKFSRVPVRIAHSHNDTRLVDRSRSPRRRTYLHVSKQLISYSATDGFACSDEAGRALFGERWAEDGRWRRLYYGIDTTLYTRHADRDGVRAELGLPVNTPLMIHVGRFEAQKNHSFLIDVLAATLRRRKNVFLLLVGSGPLQHSVSERALALGVRDHVRFCGSRADVPRLLGAADAFVFPSLHEGLSLACLEAQAAGLPVVMTDTLTREAVFAGERVSCLPLGDAAAWADVVTESFAVPSRSRAVVPSLAGSPFDIAVSTQTLLESYRHALARLGARRRTGGASRTHIPVGIRTNVGD